MGDPIILLCKKTYVNINSNIIYIELSNFTIKKYCIIIIHKIDVLNPENYYVLLLKKFFLLILYNTILLIILNGHIIFYKTYNLSFIN